MKYKPLYRVLLLLMLLLCTASVSRAEDSQTRVGRIRSALVYYLVKFVTWPGEEQGEESQEPIELCVLGDDPLNDFLTQTVEGKSVRGRPFHVRIRESLAAGETLGKCHVLFLSEEYAEKLEEKQFVVPATNVLTVCAAREKRRNHCMVQILERDNRAQIAVDLSLTTSAGFRISSELLEVADKLE